MDKSIQAIIVPSVIQSALKNEQACTSGWLSGYSADRGSTFFANAITWDDIDLAPTVDSEAQCLYHTALLPKEKAVRFLTCETAFADQTDPDWVGIDSLPPSLREECCSSSLSENIFILFDPNTSALTSIAVRRRDALVLVIPVLLDTLSFGDSSHWDTMPRSGARIESLKDRKVMIIGCGSGGADIAVHLAATGIGSLILIDHQRLEARNYSLHPLGRGYAGRPKVKAVAAYLKDHLFNVRAVTKQIDVVAKANLFRQLLKVGRPDLIICATDSLRSQRFVNHCAVAFSIPLVIGSLIGDDGNYGRIVRVRPRVGPCFECVRRAMGPLLESIEEEDIGSYYGLARSSPPTIFLHQVGSVASAVVRMSLGLLAPESFSSMPTDLLTWCAEPVADMPLPFNSQLPMTLNYSLVERSTECDVCSEAQLEA